MKRRKKENKSFIFHSFIPFKFNIPFQLSVFGDISSHLYMPLGFGEQKHLCNIYL